MDSRSAISFLRSTASCLIPALAIGLWSVGASAQIPAPKVEFHEVEPTDIRQWNNFSARISPVENVEIRPLVSGRIHKVYVNEGEIIEKGQALFLIDPRPFEAANKKAEANLATAKARARLSAQELKRSHELLNSNLISQSIFDEAFTADEVAKAAISQAESQLMEATLNLEYAHIVAPISGRVGRAELTVGNVVGAGPSAPVLTTIVSNSKVYAEFRVNEQAYLNLIIDGAAPSKMPVQLVLQDEANTILQGKLHAFDNHLDAGSGTIRARAIFDNASGVLTPGMYANVLLGSASKQSVYLIPERAIGTNQDKKFVYVIDDQNLVQYREVKLGKQYLSERIILSGIEQGDRVAVNSLTHIRPQTAVEPIPSASQKDLASSYDF